MVTSFPIYIGTVCSRRKLPPPMRIYCVLRVARVPRWSPTPWIAFPNTVIDGRVPPRRATPAAV